MIKINLHKFIVALHTQIRFHLEAIQTTRSQSGRLQITN